MIGWRPSGETVPDPATNFEDAKKFIGGWIATIHTDQGVFLVDEDGLLKGYQINVLASLEAKQTLVGAVIMLQSQEEVDQVLGQ